MDRDGASEVIRRHISAEMDREASRDSRSRGCGELGGRLKGGDRLQAEGVWRVGWGLKGGRVQREISVTTRSSIHLVISPFTRRYYSTGVNDSRNESHRDPESAN